MYSPGHNMSTEPFNTRVTHDVVCVLYAQGTGQIIFVHRVVTLGDAQPQRDEEIEADARRIMQTTVAPYKRPAASDLVALMVSPDAFQSNRTYAVDCRSRTLIEAPKAPIETD
jgi:hypothetical protein